MEDEERQRWIDEVAKRDAEIVVLKQTIDALCRRVFGKSSEQLDASQLELFEPPKKAPAADPAKNACPFITLITSLAERHSLHSASDK